MKQNPVPVGTGMLIALLSVGVLWLWISFFRFQPDDPRDFTVITGTLASAEEQITNGKSRSGHLDLRLQENTLRYCVPADGYLDYFRREAFFAEVSKGAKIQLAALASEVSNPHTFLLNSTPTIFVRGVRVGERDYCLVQDHIAWQKRNNWSGLVLAIVGSGFLAFMFIRLRRSSQSIHETVAA